MSDKRSQHARADQSELRQLDNLASKKAVALRYNPQEKAAPTVVAKGKGRVAEKIIDTAREHGVPLQEDASLVEVLSTLELDRQIPTELYQLVAEVLSFVYRTDQRADRRRGGELR